MKSLVLTTNKTSSRPSADCAARWSARQPAASVTVTQAKAAKAGRDSAAEEVRDDENSRLSGLDSLFLDLP